MYQSLLSVDILVFLRAYLTVTVSPTDHVFVGLDVTLGAQRAHPGLGCQGPDGLVLYGGVGVPVSGHVLIRAQLQPAGEGVWVLHR